MAVKGHGHRGDLSRRQVLAGAAAGAGALGLAACGQEEDGSGEEARAKAPQAGSEPANLGDLEPEAAETLPEVTKTTLAEAEKLAGVTYTDAERAQILETIEGQLSRVARLRELVFTNSESPALTFDPRLPGRTRQPGGRHLFFPDFDSPLPEDPEDIAHAPVMRQSEWLGLKRLTSERLTRIYLDRIEKLDRKLMSYVTVTGQAAMEQARQADAEIARGESRGPLHGIPFALKDLFDTSGIATTWGAEPYKDRVAQQDAKVAELLRQAGAVLLGKTALGALAYGDIWFDGITRNPWNLEEGSSGSSAGSAAAVAAGLAGFALGTETLGSIVSPANRCGVTGLRPTFGRVPRTGAMTLCASLDKIGPITRTAEDALMILDHLNTEDPGDPMSFGAPLGGDDVLKSEEMTVGYDPAWFKEASAAEKAALDALRAGGVRLKEITLPDWPYDTLLTILLAESAAYFEELTLSGQDDELTWQQNEAWPNNWRQARFIPAIDYVQADRFRRRVMEMMADKFEGLDAMIGPNYAGNMLLITNFTGHPSLTLRAGFIETPSRRPATEQVPEEELPPEEEREKHRVPQGITLWGPLFGEHALVHLGALLESRLGVWDERPPVG
ncbi:MAG: amidase [Alphaproteobacteria bacterium]